MTILTDANSKFRTKRTFSSIGDIGASEELPYNVRAENQLRIVVTGCDTGNEILVKGRIEGASTYATLATITGNTTGTTVDISLVDELCFECTTYEDDGEPTLVTSGFFEKASSGGGGGAVDSVNSQTGTVVLTTTDITEGTRLYFTNERAQDAVGAALTDTATIDLTYNDGANTITADVIPAGISHTAIANIGTNTHDQIDTHITTAAAHISSTSNPHSVTAAQVGAPPTSRAINTGSGLLGGGDLSSDRSLTVDSTAVTLTTRAINTSTGLQGGGNLTADRTLSIDSTVATLTDTQTLSNKTLTAAKIVNGGFLADANGNELLVGGTTASAVNEIKITNAATAGAPKIAAQGGDTNVDLELDAKGTGVIKLSQALSITPETLTDAATIATDASLANHFRVTLGGNRTLGNPTNGRDGQRVVWELIQDGTGSRTITLDTKFALGTDITAVTLTTTLNKRDFIGAVYNSTADKWYVLAFVKGY